LFRHIDDFFTAGGLGIAVFSKLNVLELFSGGALLLITFIKRHWPLTFLAAACFILAMTYHFWLTPNITALTELWKTTDLMGLAGTAEIPDVALEHRFYHDLYIKLDALKILLLTSILALACWREKEWS